MSLLDPQLQTFMAVVAHKTVHAAADSLHVTQTAATQRIRGLETKLKTTLFIRSRRGMALTPEGESLLHYCQAAQQLEGEALANIQGTATAATIPLLIAGPTSMVRSRILPSCFDIMGQFPRVLLSFNVDDGADLAQQLKLGDCQFAIIPPENLTQAMKHKMLKPEEYVLVCSTAWQERSLEDIIKNERIIDFNPSDTMTFEYLKHHKLFEQAQHERLFINHTELIAMAITEGKAYSVLTKEFAMPYVERGELMILNDSKTFKNTLALAWYDRPEPPAYFQAIIEGIS